MKASDVDHYVLETEEELDDFVENTLREAGADLEDLRRQAREGRFDSEKFRLTWLVVKGLGRG